ncbi:hypothetical protein [Frigoribacterium salinisoli]
MFATAAPVVDLTAAAVGTPVTTDARPAAAPSPAFASVTVSIVAPGPQGVDPAAVDLTPTQPLDMTAWLGR